MENKINKYLYKLINNVNENYLHKLDFHLMKGGYNSFDTKEILEFVLEKFNRLTTPKSSIKYLVLLYGPPASGKTKGKQMFIESYGIEENTYLDINLDEIISEDNEFKDMKTRLCVNLSHINRSNYLEDDTVKEISESYNKIRNKRIASLIFDFLVNVCSYLPYSIFLETTGFSKSTVEWYLQEVFPKYRANNFNLVVVYPKVDSVQELIDRSIERGKRECRFIMYNVDEYSRIVSAAKDNLQVLLDGCKDDVIYITFDNNTAREIPLEENTDSV